MRIGRKFKAFKVLPTAFLYILKYVNTSTLHNNYPIHLYVLLKMAWLIGCLSSFSAVFQQNHDCQSYWGRKTWENVTNLPEKHLPVGLWCLTPLSTIFQLYRGVSFIDGGNQSTWRKITTCRTSLTNLNHIML